MYTLTIVISRSVS
uniref:Uncharacterized protein n=1 Tax=Rhizophora mucronata TaxID=61149 RepID=A0A2P2QQD8_RHIMU